MKCVGIRDEDLEAYYTIPGAAALLEVHANTVRAWVKSGFLSAAKAGGESRISSDSIRSLMKDWRSSTAHSATLTVNQLNAAMPNLQSGLEITSEEMECALEELEDCHHISVDFDAERHEHVMVVYGGENPDNPYAKILKGMLRPGKNRHRCPHCDEALPRVLRAATKTPPKHKWLSSEYDIPGYPNLCLVRMSHWCVQCDKDATFFFVQIAAWAEAVRGASGLEETLREALAAYAHGPSWSHWMSYMLPTVVAEMEDKQVGLGQAFDELACVQRWRRQMMTPYSELTEREKVSDRNQATKILMILAQHRPEWAGDLLGWPGQLEEEGGNEPEHPECGITLSTSQEELKLRDVLGCRPHSDECCALVSVDALA